MAGHNCGFIKQADHRPCEAFVGPQHVFCGTHAPIAARLPPAVAGQCEHITAGRFNQHWCGRANAQNERLCDRHVLVRERQAADRVAFAARAVRAREALHEAARVAEVARVEAERLGVPPPGGGGYYGAAGPPRPAGLERIARDPQNVHTTAVVQHTNAGEQKLLAVRTDGRSVGLRVLRSFAARGGTLSGVLRVANDVEQWYNRGTCRTAGDRLYARCLEGLWTLIDQQPDKERAELKARLWEEASESVGMCCEGHIARLVNVMAGFDESFRPRVSVGEAIQTKIAEIAKMGVPTEEKVARARAYLTELAVSAEEQAPWLEALE